MTDMNIERSDVKTYWTRIYLAGDIQTAQRVCREFCNDKGLCVTVKACNYIYTGGCEAGVEIGLLAYPRFPSSTRRVRECTDELAQKLIVACGQKNVLTVNANNTCLITRTLRGEKV